MSEFITEVQVFQNFLENSDICAHLESSKSKRLIIGPPKL